MAVAACMTVIVTVVMSVVMPVIMGVFMALLMAVRHHIPIFDLLLNACQYSFLTERLSVRNTDMIIFCQLWFIILYLLLDSIEFLEFTVELSCIFFHTQRNSV